MGRVELEVRGGAALVDGAPIVILPGQDPASALILHAQSVAATRGDLLARVRDDHGVDTWLTIRQDGRVEQAAPPQPSAEPEAPQVVAPTTLNAWNAGSRGESALALRKISSKQVDRRTLLVAGAGLLGVAVLGGAAWSITSGDGKVAHTEVTPPAPKVSLPDGRSEPSGFSRESDWEVENVADLAPQVSVRDGLVALGVRVPGTGALGVRVLRADSGHQVWQHVLDPSDVITDGPFIVRRDGLVTMVATQKQLLVWDVQTGRSLREERLPRESPSVGFGLLGPWISDTGRRFYGLTSKGLKPFDIPEKSSCFGTFHDDMVVASANGQVWKLTTGKATPKPVKLQGPKGFSGGVPVMVTDRLLITSWSKERTTVLVAHELDTLKQRWATNPQTSWQAFFGTTKVAPGQRWAVVGNRHVDLSSGTTKVVAASWSTYATSDEYAWGTDGQYVLTCDQRGTLLPGKATSPVDESVIVSGGAGERVFVTTGVQGVPTLYALPRRR